MYIHINICSIIFRIVWWLVILDNTLSLKQRGLNHETRAQSGNYSSNHPCSGSRWVSRRVAGQKLPRHIRKCFPKKQGIQVNQTHRINVFCICSTPIWWIFMVHVGRYTVRPMDPMGKVKKKQVILGSRIWIDSPIPCMSWEAFPWLKRVWCLEMLQGFIVYISYIYIYIVFVNRIRQ